MASGSSINNPTIAKHARISIKTKTKVTCKIRDVCKVDPFRLLPFQYSIDFSLQTI